MGRQALSLGSLEDLDMGKIDMSFKAHLSRVAKDCGDRPNDPKARTVTIQFAIVPIPEDHGGCDRVHVQAFVDSKIPTHRTRVYDMGLNRNGTIVFNPDSPESIDQETFLRDKD